ncbi:MAG TPA: carboxypeptidase-like regulatory domain-containing protein, partial [Saprospiraceae bacterium]|nr:carboxypeptidase-like regulatory domain-containing protein [Saprospiraceae bacterium]
MNVKSKIEIFQDRGSSRHPGIGRKFMALLALMLISVFAFGQKITGTVVDSENAPLIGVNVFLKNSNVGTITDVDGKYDIQVPANQTDATLVFSYVGFLTQEVLVGTQSDITITLAEDVERLSEVVVIGYGSQKKRDVTGAVVSL